MTLSDQMPTPPPDPAGASDLSTPALFTAIAAFLVAAGKFIRDAFRSKRPAENAALTTSMASIAVAVVEMRNEIKLLREVILADHELKISRLEDQREELTRQMLELQKRVRRLEAI
jgi:hypothetical protein